MGGADLSGFAVRCLSAFAFNPWEIAVYEVVKRHKRLWIDRDGKAVYTPPNFVKLQSREPLKVLASHFTAVQARDH